MDLLQAEDLLLHYQMKINELSENLETLSIHLMHAEQLREEWKGKASERAGEKTTELLVIANQILELTHSSRENMKIFSGQFLNMEL